MLWLWLGFFVMVAALLALQRHAPPTVRGSVYWGFGYGALGLLFAAVVYAAYDHDGAGVDAAATYLSAYVLECAISFDVIFVISRLFESPRVRSQAKRHVLWWALVAGIALRVLLLLGSAGVARMFAGSVYLSGAVLIADGINCFRDDREGEHPAASFAAWVWKRLRITRGDHGNRLFVGRALTAGGVCVLAIVFAELLFAAQSLAAFSISRNIFIVVTSNVMATLAMRSLYFAVVHGGANVPIKHLPPAIGVLFLLAGAKMLAPHHLALAPLATLALVVLIIGVGVTASVLANRHEARRK